MAFPTLLVVGAMAACVRAYRLDAAALEADAAGLNPRHILAATIPAWCSALLAPGPPALRPAPGAFAGLRAPIVESRPQGRIGSMSVEAAPWYEEVTFEYDHQLDSGPDYEVWQVSLSKDVRMKSYPSEAAWNRRQSVRERLIAERFSGDRFLEFVRAWRTGEGGMFAMGTFGETLDAAVLKRSFEEVDLIARLQLISVLLDGLGELSWVGFCHGNVGPKTVFVELEPERKPRLKIGGLEAACRWRGRHMPWNRRWRLSPQEEDEPPMLAIPYLSPGVFQKRAVNTSADVFSAGMLMYELLFEGMEPTKYYEAAVLPTPEEALAKWQEFDVSTDDKFAAAKAYASQTHRWLTKVLRLMAWMVQPVARERIHVQQARTQLKMLVNRAPKLVGVQRAQQILRSARTEVAAGCDTK